MQQTTWELSVGVSLDSMVIEDHHQNSKSSGSNVETTPTLMLVAMSKEKNTPTAKFLNFMFKMVSKC